MQAGRWMQGYTHTLRTGTPGAVNVGGGRTAKGCCGPHILAVLRMADLHGQGNKSELCFAVTAPEKTTRWTKVLSWFC